MAELATWPEAEVEVALELCLRALGIDVDQVVTSAGPPPDDWSPSPELEQFLAARGLTPKPE